MCCWHGPRWVLPTFVMSITAATDIFKMVYLMEKVFLIRALLVIFTGLFKLAVGVVA